VEQHSTDLQRARQMLKSGEYESGLALVESLLSESPGDIALLFLQGILLRRLGRHSQAKPALQQVVKAAPQLAAAAQELGLSLYSLREVDAARSHLQQAVSLDANLGECWKALGELHAMAGREEESAAAFRRQLLAEHSHPAMRQAVELLERGKLGMAEGICRDYLQRYPRDVHAIRLLAEIGMKLGIFPEARALLEACLELAPDYHLARNNFANALGRAHRFDEALKEVAYLERVEPNNLSHPVLAASLHANAGNFTQALERYENLLQQVPDHAPLQTSYGHALKTVGRQEDSIAAYRNAISVQPHLGEAWWSLANLKTIRFSAEQHAQMEALLATDKLTRTDRYQLAFALAKAREDKGEYDAAFASYEQGNALKKQTSGYEAQDHHQRIRETIRHCDSALFESHTDVGHPATDPIFIVGLPRAGSTLLEQILASHSLVEGTMELPYIAQLARELGGKKKKTDTSRYPACLRELGPAQCRELGQRYLDDAQMHRTDRPFFIDKMPNNFAHIALIKLILPKARIIDARRHPMASCFSGYKQLFAAGQEFTYSLEDIGRYYVDYLTLMDHWNLVLPGQVLLMEYEAVVADLEPQVRRLLAHCKLDFEPDCLEFHRSQRAVRTASSEQVRQPLYTEGLDHWRHFESHLEPLKQVLAPVAHRYPI
jgi:tetratricopeptide (TPR) repeat protein